MNKLSMHTPSLADSNFSVLVGLFPNAVTETIDENGAVIRAIDADILAQEINTRVISGKEERYQFTWPDKKKSILLANAPIAAALRPCREESVDFDNTGNLYIEGDNLDVLKLLRETYLNRVKMIYIDPPYNTGKDFIYEDDFTEDANEFLRRDGQYDDQGNRLTSNMDSNGRFHTDWLNMIYPRLRVARDLLSEDGAIFISIDDNEIQNLKKICNEIFGENNFVGQISVINNLKGRNDRKNIATCHEYLLIYGKYSFESNGLPLTDEQRAAFDKIDENGNAYQLRDLRKRGRPDRREDRPNMYFPIYYNITTKECSLEPHADWIEIFPLRGDGSDGRWRWGRERVQTNLTILEPKLSTSSGKWGVEHRVYLNPALNPALSPDENDDEENSDERLSKSKSFWTGGELSSDVARRTFRELMGNTAFDYPKSVDFIKKTLFMGADTDSIILDFFSGSATTAHAIMQLNAEDSGRRKFIMVQLPEVCPEGSEAAKAGYATICEVGKERIRRAGAKIKEEAGLMAQGLDIGFRVLKLDSSNMKDVYYTPEKYAQLNFNIDDFTDNIKNDRSDEDLLFQVMLDLGIPLSAKITKDGKMFCVDGNYLIACFDKVDTNLITEIAKRQPYYAVFRDNSFLSDSALVNFEQVFNTYSPKTIRRVL